jgi:hypothetical protein
MSSVTSLTSLLSAAPLLTLSNFDHFERALKAAPTAGDTFQCVKLSVDAGSEWRKLSWCDGLSDVLSFLLEGEFSCVDLSKRWGITSDTSGVYPMPLERLSSPLLVRGRLAVVVFLDDFYAYGRHRVNEWVLEDGHAYFSPKDYVTGMHSFVRQSWDSDPGCSCCLRRHPAEGPELHIIQYEVCVNLQKAVHAYGVDMLGRLLERLLERRDDFIKLNGRDYPWTTVPYPKMESLRQEICWRRRREVMHCLASSRFGSSNQSSSKDTSEEVSIAALLTDKRLIGKTKSSILRSYIAGASLSFLCYVK